MTYQPLRGDRLSSQTLVVHGRPGLCRLSAATEPLETPKLRRVTSDTTNHARLLQMRLRLLCLVPSVLSLLVCTQACNDDRQIAAMLAKPHRLTLRRHRMMGAPPVGSAASVVVDWTAARGTVTSARWLAQSAGEACTPISRIYFRDYRVGPRESSPHVRALSRKEHQRVTEWLSQQAARNASRTPEPPVSVSRVGYVAVDVSYAVETFLDGVEVDTGSLLDELSGSPAEWCVELFHSLASSAEGLSRPCTRDEDCMQVKLPDQILGLIDGIDIEPCHLDQSGNWHEALIVARSAKADELVKWAAKLRATCANQPDEPSPTEYVPICDLGRCIARALSERSAPPKLDAPPEVKKP